MTGQHSRLDDLRRLYAALDNLRVRLSGTRTLLDCSGRQPWPARGVYFFFEDGEGRSDSGEGPRVVRVGTHALKAGSRTSLWNRLSQHRGVGRDGGGSHRGSIFRLHVGTSLMARDAAFACETWGRGQTAKGAIRDGERGLEGAVSNVIRAMPFLWLAIEDEAGPASGRGDIERNAIGLLSNFERPPLDAASRDWLGRGCNRESVRKSGLWNVNHVADGYDPTFLDRLERLVEEQR